MEWDSLRRPASEKEPVHVTIYCISFYFNSFLAL